MSADPIQLPIWLTPLLQTAIISGVGLLIRSVRALGTTVGDLGKMLATLHGTVYGVEGGDGLTQTSVAHGRDIGELREWRREIDLERRVQQPIGRRSTDHA